jgi:lipopolysaccharide transport system ATP-binding protein
MSEVAIRVSGLSKAYEIYAQPSDRLRQFVWPRLQRLLGRPARQYHRDFWALRDASFEVRRGQAVGIIGRNGSGKSTLLQIICGTLTPTHGQVRVNGRVAALLELGTGFNPEFTGHENVYLNAAVLGLTPQQIDERFLAITQFADIGEFINQPVKTYSSGMLVRLAFAVIAHVDADILVIDEALAVGDAYFTQKCMRFIRGFKEKGTILFVSHDVGSVRSLCEEAIWLDQGEVKDAGDVEGVTQQYQASIQMQLQEAEAPLAVQIAGSDIVNPLQKAKVQNALVEHIGSNRAYLYDNLNRSSGWATGSARLIGIDIEDLAGNKMHEFEGGEVIRLKIKATALRSIYSPILGFVVKDKLGQALFGEHTFTYMPTPIRLETGNDLLGLFEFQLPYLPDGDYAIAASIAEGTPEVHIQHHWLHEICILQVRSPKLRHGLVGIPFLNVSIKII